MYLNKPFPYLVSIIIPTYNSISVLANCLASIEMQDFTGRQVVIVDGGSTDGTLEEISKFCTANPSAKFVSEPDKGIYDAMNKGIALSDGEWLLFLGADDELYEKTTLTNVAETLSKTESKLVYGNAKLIGDASWATDGTVYDGYFSLTKLFEKNICHQSIFYTKNVFKETENYNLHFPVCADWDLNFRCFARTQPVFVDQIISKFRGGGYSTANTVDAFHLQSIFLLKKYFKLHFFSPLFHPYEWVFYENALIDFRRKRYLHGMYMWVAGLYNSRNRRAYITVSLGKLKSKSSSNREKTGV